MLLPWVAMARVEGSSMAVDTNNRFSAVVAVTVLALAVIVVAVVLDEKRPMRTIFGTTT